MKKVVYSVTKLGRNENKLKGVGYLADNDLVIACISNQGKPYIRVFEDCAKYCRLRHNSTDEFKGSYSEILEVQVEKNGSFETREIEVNYNIWYKITE